jgi:hypothetical protein
VVRNDFASWLPAMLVKELRQGLRTRGFVGAFIAFQVLMAIAMMTVAAQSASISPGARSGAFAAANGFFWTLITVALLLVTPGRALGSLKLEMTSRTVDLLLLTQLSAWRIVTGKWLSLMAQAVLLLVSLLPYGIVRYFAGSVDLVNDAVQCATLLGGAALLTAAGLWGAGLGRFVGLLGVVFGLFAFGSGGRFFASLTGGGSPFGTLRLPPGGAGLVWFDGALVLVFFLVAAVRNIAPPAENHTLLTRLLPVLALLPVPLIVALAGPGAAAGGQLLFAGGFLLLVCATQLASYDLPMGVHFRAARQRPAGLRVFLRMTLPGWPSALLYTLFVTMLWVGCAALLPATGKTSPIWIGVLALTALVTPCLVMAVAPRPARFGASIYLVTLITAGGLTPLCFAFIAMAPKLVWLKGLVAMLPVSSLLMAFIEPDAASGAQVAFMGALPLVIVGVAWWQARPYWHYLGSLERRHEAEVAAEKTP